MPQRCQAVIDARGDHTKYFKPASTRRLIERGKTKSEEAAARAGVEAESERGEAGAAGRCRAQALEKFLSRRSVRVHHRSALLGTCILNIVLSLRSLYYPK